MQRTFQVLRVDETSKGQFEFRIEQKSLQDLPEGNTLIRVEYSSLNYKDALSATGNRGITRAYPHIPGIDAAGKIEESDSKYFNPGDQVIVTGFDLGMNTWGGYSEYIRVPDKWVLPLPKGLTPRKAMELGTAGLTAGLSVLELLKNGIKSKDKILLTGATGGVGIISLSVLSQIGCRVTAVTGKKDYHELLRKMGASEILSRHQLQEKNQKALLKGEYAGAVDVAGGSTLAAVLKRMRYKGIVTCCGMVDSSKLETTIYPFILRGVRLIGIDSAECDLKLKKEVWNKFAANWKFDFLPECLTECTLEEVPHYIEKMLRGETIGRVVVKTAR
ncbi:quinone oxidoreductase [candidate division MSBL1 archaeon SCGC-AAA382M17]|uniref:Quinone oxidoreductase n=1 Tax=candidate division MSBL1 archaeon SCGC-AAA382M17 TaxID=1698284 RepID=A0ABR5TJX0_9EURY|nr:quinone oxidoreductase [candidate division MSBL1 archaeon SCGC-AAA382M17]